MNRCIPPARRRSRQVRYRAALDESRFPIVSHPACLNDGRRIDPEKLKALKKRLVDQFGGLTHFQQENEGLWKIGDHTFRDRVEILRVLVNDEAAARKYFTELKADLTREWEQQDFLIVTRQVSAL